MVNEELDPAQQLAEEARQKAAEHHKTQEQLIHNLASNITKNFKEPDYKSGELAVEQHQKQVEKVPPTKKVNSNVGAFIDLGDHKIAVTGIPVIDMTAIMVYIFMTVLAENPRIAEILKKAKIQLQDIKGTIISPPSKKTAKKKKKRA